LAPGCGNSRRACAFRRKPLVLQAPLPHIPLHRFTACQQEPTMNPLNLVTRPVRNITRAITMPFTFLFVVGLTGFINWMTFSGNWLFKWVAFGMGITVLVAWARAAKTLVLLGLLAWAGWWIYRRYGQAARQRFDAWAAKTSPDAAGVLDALRAPSAWAGSDNVTAAQTH
jgi:hypothetical protein